MVDRNDLGEIGTTPLIVGDLTAGSAKIVIGGSGVGAVLGPGASVDLGTVTLDNLSDVIITTPVSDEILAYNGAEWVNAPAGSVSAGPGVEFFLDDTDIITGPTDPTSIHTLSKTPSAGIEVIDSIVVNSNTLLKEMFLYNTAIGGANIDAGIWNFETFCAVDNVANVSEVLINVAKVVLKAGTVTTTGGPGTATRTVSASGTPFVAGDANANLASCSYLQTPSGIFPITAFASTASVTITVPLTYVDEGPVAFSIHYKLFQVTTGDINSTSVLLYSTQTVQASFAIGATDKLSAFYFGKTTRAVNTTISFYHGGSAHYSHFTSPLVVRHNDLSGLQGGSANEYYHLTSAEYSDLWSNPMTLLGDIIYGGPSPAGVATRLEGNTTTTKKYLRSPGNGSVSAAPTFEQIAYTDISGTPALPLAVASGGTGRASHTAYALIIGGSTTTNPQQSIGNPGTTGCLLRSNGSSASPVWTTATFPSSPGISGNVVVSNGTNWVMGAGPTYTNPQTDHFIYTNFAKTNTTLANIGSLARSLLALEYYYFRAHLFVTADVTSGHKYAVAYSGSISQIIYEIKSVDDSSGLNVITSRQTSSGGSAGQSGATSIETIIEGWIETGSGGTLSIQFALNAGTTSGSVLAGSTLTVIDLGVSGS
jgi:hypothetical protein